MAKQTAVVFAYHNIGVIGLTALLNNGVEIPLVVTHQDQPDEHIWFDSVADLADKHGIPVITPTDPNRREVLQKLQELQPQWLFSFYYRQLLSSEILAIPERGAYNLHGSLLPKYRGRAPVNWAVLHGERETGVSLHRMLEKPDAGDLVDQLAVPIDTNDTARDVFLKLGPAAERLLARSLPRLLQGTARLTPLDLARGSYFSGRKPEDGRIDWRQSAWQIHNLIRAVAPPYPGAFFTCQGKTVAVLGSRYADEAAVNPQRPVIYWQQGRLFADCADNKRFLITRLACNGHVPDQTAFYRLFNSDRIFPQL